MFLLFFSSGCTRYDPLVVSKRCCLVRSQLSNQSKQTDSPSSLQWYYRTRTSSSRYSMRAAVAVTEHERAAATPPPAAAMSKVVFAIPVY